MDTSANVSFNAPASPIGDITNTYKGLETGYGNAINSQPTVPQLTAKYNDQFGVPKLQQQVQEGNAQSDMLGNQIQALPKSIAQASQESILTQGQKDRMVQAQQSPLLQEKNNLDQNLTRTQQNLGTAQTNAGQMIGAEQAQQTKQLLPWTQQFSDEAVIAAHQMTGWTTENSNELQVLLANQSAGITLSEGQKNRLNALAVGEQQFENNLKLQQNQQSQPNFASVNGGLYNTTSNSWAVKPPLSAFKI